MNKSIILAVLLVPCLCLAKTKKEILERQAAIVAEVKEIESNVKYLDDIIKYNFWVVYLDPERFRTQFAEFKERTIALNKEYYQLEEEKHA